MNSFVKLDRHFHYYNSSGSELTGNYTKLSGLCLTFNQDHLYIESKNWLH